MRRWLKPLWVLIALVFLVEAWLWSHLAPVVRWVVDLVPWRWLKDRLAAMIEALPPYATLLVFLIPIVLLFPLKLAGLWMLAHGSWFGAMAVLVFAKLLSTGVTAFIFNLTRPKLLQLGWFRWIYDHVMVWLEKAHALIDPIKAQIKARLADMRARARAWLATMLPTREDGMLRYLARLRRMMQAQ